MSHKFEELNIPGVFEVGVFISREKKFIGTARLQEREVRVFVPNTGKLTGVLEHDSRILVRNSEKKGRSIEYDLVASEVNGSWVTIDTTQANRLIRINLDAHTLSNLEPYTTVRSEVRIGESRFDFVINGPDDHIVEVKSCTKACGNTAKFPDTISTRSTKHARELAALAASGCRCTIIFLAMRPEVDRFTPNKEDDPDFAKELESAAGCGVNIAAYSTILMPPVLEILKPIDIRI